MRPAWNCPVESPPSLAGATADFVEFFVARGLLDRRLRPDELLEPRFIE